MNAFGTTLRGFGTNEGRMISSDEKLIKEPMWKPENLGEPLPESIHANSVCLPQWQDIIDYEEKKPRVMESLKAGYPRFVIPNPCLEFFGKCHERFGKENEICHAYPTERSAERAAAYIARWTEDYVNVFSWPKSRVHVICFPKASEPSALKYWRHAGEGISSRHALALLEDRKDKPDVAARVAVTNRIADLAGVSADCVFLFKSGMAGIFALYRSLMKMKPDGTCIQYGFPYVDTLKIHQGFGHRSTFFPLATDTDMKLMARMGTIDTVGGLMTEFPSNPLLISPDLKAICQHADYCEFPVIVDDTISTWVNTDILPHVDATVTSLTKYFTGRGDLMAGVVILNPNRKLHGKLSAALKSEYEDSMWGENITLLNKYSIDFVERMRQINTSAEKICDWLQYQPEVEKIYYPKYQAQKQYDAYKRPDGGYSGLFSILLKNAETRAPKFYDNLKFSKGPNLGTTFSLCCPFTLLAHYDELDWAEQCGVSRNLLRFSIGLEDPDDLIKRIDDALKAAFA